MPLLTALFYLNFILCILFFYHLHHFLSASQTNWTQPEKKQFSRQAEAEAEGVIWVHWGKKARDKMGKLILDLKWLKRGVF